MLFIILELQNFNGLQNVWELNHLRQLFIPIHTQTWSMGLCKKLLERWTQFIFFLTSWHKIYVLSISLQTIYFQNLFLTKCQYINTFIYISNIRSSIIHNQHKLNLLLIYLYCRAIYQYHHTFDLRNRKSVLTRVRTKDFRYWIHTVDD